MESYLRQGIPESTGSIPVGVDSKMEGLCFIVSIVIVGSFRCFVVFPSIELLERTVER